MLQSGLESGTNALHALLVLVHRLLNFRNPRLYHSLLRASLNDFGLELVDLCSQVLNQEIDLVEVALTHLRRPDECTSTSGHRRHPG